ncbi:MAG: protein translocase subunit SecF [candidate division KSB1 bacterium]|nr:protein translocase subunit SecF [candidate division KSB1 bacterium]
MRLIKDTHIDFVGTRKIWITISIILISIGIISLILRGGPKYGIDFTGGTSLQIRFDKKVDIGEIRRILSGIGLGNSEIKEFAVGNEFLIRLQQQAQIEALTEKVIGELSTKLAGYNLELRSRETVGPRIGSELRRDTIKAIFFSLLLLLIYISWRFEFKFAVGAVVALFHDVMITLGFFSVFNLEISLTVVAAFLTLIGFSLNDTIVVFDRIRENLKIMRKDNYVDIFNISINQTLSRTVLTSVTVFFVTLILLLFGGEVLRNFAFALTVGIIVGTYSSVYIASPVVIGWYMSTERKKAARA